MGRHDLMGIHRAPKHLLPCKLQLAREFSCQNSKEQTSNSSSVGNLQRVHFCLMHTGTEASKIGASLFCFVVIVVVVEFFVFLFFVVLSAVNQTFTFPGPDKFAAIFLGEFDTPEAIWNSEMR